MKKKWLLLSGLLILGFCLVLPNRLTGQEEDVIKDIVFTTSDGVPLVVHPERLKRKIRLRKGEKFSPITLDEDVRRLYATGYFDKVEPMVAKEANGVTIKFVVVEAPVVAETKVVGNKRVNSKKIKKAITLNPGDYISQSKLNEQRNAILDIYKSKSYLDTKVDIETTPVAKGHVVTFNITEGHRYSVQRIATEGNTYFSNRSVRRAMKTKLDTLFRSGKFIQEEFDLDIHRVEAKFRNAGFLDVKVAPTVEKSTIIPAKPRKKIPIYITLKIEEGPRYKIDGIEIKGATIIAEKKMLDVIKQRPDDWYSPEQAMKDRDIILNLYGDEGRIFSTVNYNPVILEKPGRLRLVYTIEEGKPVTVRYIIVRGNTITKDVVVRREVRLAPGDTAKLERIKYSERRIKELNIFEGVKITPKKVSDTVTDLEVDVEETKSARLIFGAGAGGNGNVFGRVTFLQRNFDIFNPWTFKGDAQELSARAQVGTKNSIYSIDFFEPYIFDRPWSLGLGAYKSDDEFDEWEEERLGAYVTIGKEITEKLNVTFTLRPEQIDISDVDDDAPYVIRSEEGDATLVKFIPRIEYNNTNSKYYPTKGFSADMSYQYVGGILGGDYDFYKVLANVNYFITVGKTKEGNPHVVHFHVGGGYTDEFEDSRVPVYERYFLGGVNSVRGYRPRSVGPEVGRDRIGGTTYVVGNVEYSFPIYQDILRGASFYDIGRNWEPGTDYYSDLWRSSVGIGLHIRVPFFGPTPIRFYYAHPLDREEDMERQELQFTFGINL